MTIIQRTILLILAVVTSVAGFSLLTAQEQPPIGPEHQPEIGPMIQPEVEPEPDCDKPAQPNQPRQGRCPIPGLSGKAADLLHDHWGPSDPLANRVEKSGSRIAGFMLSLFNGIAPESTDPVRQNLLAGRHPYAHLLKEIGFDPAPTGLTIGDELAPIQVFVYSDYQCPFCAAVDNILIELTTEIPEMAVTHKDFPLDSACNPVIPTSFHRFSCKAAIFTRCAQREGKFWPASMKVFEAQHDLDDDKFKEIAEELGLEWNRMKACLEDERVVRAIRVDIQEAVRLDLQGTPGIVIDNWLLTGEFNPEDIKKIIQYEVEASKPAP